MELLTEANLAKKREQYKLTKPSKEAFGWKDFNDYVSSQKRNSSCINYSSILSELIQLAGRYCDSYASDLFIMWEMILRRFDASDFPAVKHTILGFYNQGVDCGEEVLIHALNVPFYYRKIAAVDITCDQNTGDMKMQLQVFDA